MFLDAFIKQCEGIDVISLTPSEIDLKLVSVQWSKMSRADRDDHARRHLVSMLVARSRRKPLLVAIDEAHILDPRVGRILLNASQRVRRSGAQFLLTLAGTPGLRTHLDRMDAMFWDRAEIIGIGRLDAASTRETLEVPLDNTYGISFDNDTLEMVVAESQHYPYFIQM